jgi:heme-degrading monooxygenase HmoA
MILRRWTARATPPGARRYERRFRDSVPPDLAGLAGPRGAYLLQRREGDHVELTVLTVGASMDAVRDFAGDDPERAVVEPRAREVLDAFDEVVTHHEVVVDTVAAQPGRGGR